MKIYTKTGDKGETSLYDGTRVNKDDIRVESYGTLDKLNSYIGLCTNYAKDEDNEILRNLQIKLFAISAELATKEVGKYKNTKNLNKNKNYRIIFYSSYFYKVNYISANMVHIKILLLN